MCIWKVIGTFRWEMYFEIEMKLNISHNFHEILQYCHYWEQLVPKNYKRWAGTYERFCFDWEGSQPAKKVNHINFRRICELPRFVSWKYSLAGDNIKNDFSRSVFRIDEFGTRMLRKYSLTSTFANSFFFELCKLT